MMENNLATADQEQPAGDAFDIAAIESEHALWLETEGKEGKRANFRGVDLTRVDLAGRRLAEASLRGSNLTGANLSGIDLRAADLVETILDSANFSGASLAGASLTRAQMHHMNATGADLTSVNLMAATGEGINFSGAKLNNAILRDVNFRHTDFTQAQLRDSQMRGASITDANMSNADLSGADCRDVVFDHTRFQGAQLTNTSFRGARLGGVDLQAADFSAATDVAAEFQTQSLQTERTKIQDEQVQIAQIRRDLELRESALIADKAKTDEKYAAITAIESEMDVLAMQLKQFSLGFITRFIIWLALGLALLGVTIITAMNIEHPDIGRLSVIIAAVCVVLGLAGFSMMRSLQTAKLAKKFAEACERRPEGSASADMPSLVSPPPMPSLTTKPSRMSGFGKRK